MDEEDEDVGYTQHGMMNERNQTIPNYDEASEIQRLTEAANNSLQYVEQHLNTGKRPRGWQKGRPRKKRTSEGGDQGLTADGTKPKRRRGKSANFEENSAPLLNLPCFRKPLSPMPDLEGLNLPLAYAGTEDIATYVPKVPPRRKSRPTIKMEPQPIEEPPKYKPGTTMEPMSPLGVPHAMASPPLPHSSMAIPQMTSPRRQVSHDSYLPPGLPPQLAPTAPAMSPQVASPQMVSPQMISPRMLSPRQPSPQRSPISSGSMSDTQKKHPLLSTILSVTSPGGSKIPPTASPPGMVSPVDAPPRPPQPRTSTSPTGGLSPLSLMAKMQGPTQAPPFAFPPGIKPLDTPSTPATPSTADSVFASPTTPIQQEFPAQEDIKPFKNLNKGKLPKFDPRLFPMDPVVLAQMRPEDIPMPGQPPKIPSHVQQQMIAQGMQKQIPHQVPQASSAVSAAQLSKPTVTQPQIPQGMTSPVQPALSAQQLLQLQQQALLHAAQQVRPEVLPPAVPQVPVEQRAPQQVPPPQQIPSGPPVTTIHPAFPSQPPLPAKEQFLGHQVPPVSAAPTQQEVLPTPLGVPEIPQVEPTVPPAENIPVSKMNVAEAEQRMFATEVPTQPTEQSTEQVQTAISAAQDVQAGETEQELQSTSAKPSMKDLIKSELLAAAWGSRNPLPPVSLSAKLPDPKSALTPPSMLTDSAESDAKLQAYTEATTGTTAPPHTLPYQTVSTPASVPSVPAEQQPPVAAVTAGGPQPGLTLPPISTLQSKIPPGMVPGISTLESPPVTDGKEGAEIPAPGQISVPRGALRSPVSGFDKDPMLSVPVPVPSTADPQIQPVSTQPSPPVMSHAELMRHPLAVAGRLPPPFPLAFAPGLPPVALMMQPPSPLNFPNRPKSPTGPGVPAMSQAPTRATQANHIPAAPTLAQQRSPTSEKHKALATSLQSPTANTQTQQLEMIMEIMRRELAAGQQQQIAANVKKEGVPNNDQIRPLAPAPGPTMEMLIAIMQREMAAAQAMQLQAAALQAANAGTQASPSTLQAAQRAQAQAATQVANLQAAQQQIAQAQAKLAQSQLVKAATTKPQPAAKLPPLIPPPVVGASTVRQDMLSPSSQPQPEQQKSHAVPLSVAMTVQQAYDALNNPQIPQQPLVAQPQV